jgi:uncharacterized membrane protein YhaH (DUF805 family)
MKRPVGWITRSADYWYVLACIVIQAILVTALARLIGGEPVSERRIRLGSAAYATVFSGVFTLIGLAIGDAIRA